MNDHQLIGAMRLSNKLLRLRIKTLRECCVGSRAAFVKLLADRNALNDFEIGMIVQRLYEVILDES